MYARRQLPFLKVTVVVQGTITCPLVFVISPKPKTEGLEPELWWAHQDQGAFNVSYYNTVKSKQVFSFPVVYLMQASFETIRNDYLVIVLRQ